MRLRARGARMQFTNFSDRSTASGTRNGQYLLRGELFRFHHHMMQLSGPGECSILTILDTFNEVVNRKNGVPPFLYIPIKTDHLWLSHFSENLEG